MNDSADPTGLDVRFARLVAALRDADQVLASIAPGVDLAEQALKMGRADLAVALLETVVNVAPLHAPAWQLLGFACGAEQLIPRAVQAFARAVELDPRNARSAFAHARASFDAGSPAVVLYERAHFLAPDDLATLDGWAAALSAQGHLAAAEQLLVNTLTGHPEWLAGHKKLAALRSTSGDRTTFARSYPDACERVPGNLPLRMAWFGEVMRVREWGTALTIIEDGEKLLGPSEIFVAARAVVAGESGDRVLAQTLFERAAAIADDSLRIAHVRHCLRTSQFARAEMIALQVLQGPAAPLIWPYLSLIWRLTRNPRAQWLDGAPPYIRAFDLDYSAADLLRLATVLRRLHTAQAPFLGQSVQGGTQTDTDQQLFFRNEPDIQVLRSKVQGAIREYLAGLPAFVAGHPLLGAARSRILFAGSWSVRLQAGGFHVSHHHPLGWISSAFYVSLPTAMQRGGSQAGWLRFGLPAQDLGLRLDGYGQVEPKPGRLVLFPSTMWHETVPFDDGERLVVAFDVMRRR